jgi:hypothetical protein
VGFKSSVLDLVSWYEGKFCVVSHFRNIVDGFNWRFIVVYGSPYEEFKLEFIDELDSIMSRWQGPTIVGGLQPG